VRVVLTVIISCVSAVVYIRVISADGYTRSYIFV